MTWTFHNAPDFRVTTARFFAVIGRAQGAAELHALRREVRRHLRLTSIYESAAGIADPERMRDGRYRIAIVGRPYRAWTLSELLGQLRRIGLTNVEVLIADTHTESEAALLWQSLSEVLDESVATPFAQVGGAVLDTAAGAGDAIAPVGQGLREGLPALGEGLGDLAGAAGEAAQTVGAAARWSPTSTLVVVGLVLGFAWLVSSGALRFAPIKVG